MVPSSFSLRRSLPVLAGIVLAAGLLHARAQDETPRAGAVSLDEISWIAGHWRQKARGRTTEELWMPPAGGMMLGTNRTVPLAGKTTFEYLRIEVTPDGIDYVASPSGQGATRFRLVEADEKLARFENPKHDFPTVIEYRLEGEGTLVTSALGPDGKGMSWKFERAAELD